MNGIIFCLKIDPTETTTELVDTKIVTTEIESEKDTEDENDEDNYDDVVDIFFYT